MTLHRLVLVFLLLPSCLVAMQNDGAKESAAFVYCYSCPEYIMYEQKEENGNNIIAELFLAGSLKGVIKCSRMLLIEGMNIWASLPDSSHYYRLKDLYKEQQSQKQKPD